MPLISFWNLINLNFFCRLFEESMERSVLAIIFIIMHYYYTMYSLSTYVLAKSVQLFLGTLQVARTLQDLPVHVTSKHCIML